MPSQTRMWMMVAVVLVATSPGVVAAADLARTAGAPDSMEATIDQDLQNLTASLTRLDAQLHELRQRPVPTDAVLQSLRRTHEAGWDLHRRQWLFQREHLEFAREQLRRAKAHPEERNRLAEAWRTHQDAFERGMAAFRQERAALEHQQFELEGKLIEQALAAGGGA